MSRLLTHRVWEKLRSFTALAKEGKACSSDAQSFKSERKVENISPQKKTIEKPANDDEKLLKYRFIYPEFLPDPNPLYRNALRERLERQDMLARRNQIAIPEFYVGSIVAVTIAEPHAPEKVNRFLGICIQRGGCGLRAYFRLRNVVDGNGVEVLYHLYDPAVTKIECIRLEKRLDKELLYLRDAPLEYSTFSFNMEREMLPEGSEVPVNDIQVPLKPPPWLEKWERQGLKGVKDLVVGPRRQMKAKAAAKPWEKYDLMKIYRETISKEEQCDIFSELRTDLRKLEIEEIVQKRKRTFVRPKKAV